jgi:hypothetical protein
MGVKPWSLLLYTSGVDDDKIHTYISYSTRTYVDRPGVRKSGDVLLVVLFRR